MRYADGAARFLTGTPNVPALYARDRRLRPDRGDRRRADPRELAPPDRPPDRRSPTRRGFEVASPREPRAPRRHGHRPRARLPGRPQELAERQILCDFRPGRRASGSGRTTSPPTRARARDRADRRDRRDRRARARTSAPSHGIRLRPMTDGAAVEPRDRPGRDAPTDRGDRRAGRASSRTRSSRTAARRRRSTSSVLDRLRDTAGRQARLRHRDHADEGGRGQDDDLGLADAGPRPHRPQAGALPARGLARAGLRDQGRRGRRRLRAGRADGGPEPALHRRHPRDRRGEQPARGDARGAHPARERARDRPALGRLAALRRHQRPRSPQRRRRPRRPRERLRARVGLRHHRRLRGDGDRRRRPRPARPARAARRDHGRATPSRASRCSPSSCGPRAR